MKTLNHYKALQKRVLELKEILIPKKINPLGIYKRKTKVHLKTASFIILVHAEIEFFIEQVSLVLFDKGYHLWQTKKIPNFVVLSLLAYSGKTINDSKQKSKNLDEQIQQAQSAWRGQYKKNNGIKEINILNLLTPLGIEKDEIDTILLNDLNSFGSLRGEKVHTSVLERNGSNKIKNPLDPATEHARIENIIKNLESIYLLIKKNIKKLEKLNRVKI